MVLLHYSSKYISRPQLPHNFVSIKVFGDSLGMIRAILGVLLITFSIHSAQAYNLEVHRQRRAFSNILFATTDKKATKMDSTNSVSSLIDDASRSLIDRYVVAFVGNMKTDIKLT